MGQSLDLRGGMHTSPMIPRGFGPNSKALKALPWLAKMSGANRVNRVKRLFLLGIVTLPLAFTSNLPQTPSSFE